MKKLLFLLLLFGCIKDNNNSDQKVEKNIMGKWYNDKDTLTIDSQKLYCRFDTFACMTPNKDTILNKYDYDLSEDSISILYTGWCRIGIPKCKTTIIVKTDSFYINQNLYCDYGYHKNLLNTWYKRIK